MRVTTGMSQRHVLTDLRRVQERLASAQSQVSGGKRIEKPSDDPLGAERAMRLSDQLETTKAYKTAVDESRNWLDATDTALGSLGDVVQRVRELTLQAANGSTTPAGRQSIKLEIDQLTEQVKTTLSGAFDGRHLFSGTATRTAPYSAATGDAYQGDSAPVVRQIGPGVSVQVNITGDDVLAGLLPTLRTISAHLASNDVASLGTSDLHALDAGADTLTAKRAQVGAITNRVDAAGQRLDDVYDVTDAFLSKTQDADLPQALTDLSAQQNALQAALRGGATLIQQSLMDFLR
ncbi:MAG TPA: flagellar hook-associated protein FlgL [Solirubrobacteraceae bacterium]|nr:flagellar hook-associated protein FlgL [Solirubrobacteraceae bacterium]